jgi:hypothetical protein
MVCSGAKPGCGSRVTCDNGFDAGLAQRGFHEPVEVRRQHDAYVPGSYQAGNRPVRSGGLLLPLLTVFRTGLEVGPQQRLPFQRGVGETAQEVVVGGCPVEALLVPGVRVTDLSHTLGSRHLPDQILLDVPRGRHTRCD